MISLYVIALGTLFFFMGTAELCLRKRFFQFWMRWFAHRLFFLHGIILVLLGFPLTFYNGKWSTFVFLVGLFMVITGPFVIIYPEKIRESFEDISLEMGEDTVRRLVLFDSAVRLIIGIIFLYCAISTYVLSSENVSMMCLWYF